MSWQIALGWWLLILVLAIRIAVCGCMYLGSAYSIAPVTRAAAALAPVYGGAPPPEQRLQLH